MRRFMMLRQKDVTGVSGTGHIADGVVFDDGTTAIRWRGENASTTIYPSLEKAKIIHLHGENTNLVFHDEYVGDPKDPKNTLKWLCCMCFSDMDIPVNHCYQCGSGGSAIAMAKWQFEAIQTHDKHRLDSITTLLKEAKALRRVVIDTFGPRSLGFTLKSFEYEGVTRFSPQCGNVSCGLSVKREGETDEECLSRLAPDVPLDPEMVIQVYAERKR